MTWSPSQIHSSQPWIAQYDGWLSPEETELIMHWKFDLVPGRMRHRSGELALSPIRQCMTHRIEFGHDDYFDSLTQRVAAFFNVALNHVEPMPLVKYSSGDYFDCHSDLTDGFQTQRIATMIMYLNDDFQGGCTYFPKFNLRIQPRRGSALVYYYDVHNPLVHQGETVVAGTKQILTAFVRNGEFSLADRQSVRY